MSDERWKRQWDLFHRVSELPEEERRSFLDRECPDDPDLVGEVLELLSSHPASNGGFMERPPRLADVADAVPGEHIGPYVVVRELGAGGMGVVYLAEQKEPVRRQVALKLLRTGMDSGEFLSRFEAERQALALMSHPGIARIYDAGVTSRGRPYLAMEYVPGEPIHRFCDSQRLDTDQRLDLFVRVCEAVQHAHERGVIHRDLKPSNILVTTEDDRPAPKIIDFGVAKAIDRPLTAGAEKTRADRLIGTPEYMSPEQAGLDVAGIDTRTDVYALGVVLYELLSGAQPFDPDSLRRAGFDEIRRIIREEDPPRPSTRIESHGPDSAIVAERRRTDPPSLVRQIRGDLDWITMKALEKERDRRYRSPADFAEDLRRYRGNVPVEARPPSASYRAAKFVRRHRLGVTAAAIVTVGLLVGIALGAWGLLRALEAEREARAEAAASTRIADFMISLFEKSDPKEARGDVISARDVLDAGVERIETELADDPEVRARLLNSMASVYRSLGDYDKALELFERERELLEDLHGADDPATLGALGDVAVTYWYLGRHDEAEPLLRRTLESRERTLGPDHIDTLSVKGNLAIILKALGRNEEAGQLLQQVLDARRRTLGDEHLHTLSAMNSLALLFHRTGNIGEAEKLQTEALAIIERTEGEDHPQTTATRNNLALIYKGQERFDEAEVLFRRNLEIQRRVLGNEHLETLRTMSTLGDLLRAQERLDDAEKMLEETYDMQRRLLGDQHAETVRTLEFLVRVYWLTARGEENREKVERLIALRTQAAEEMPDNIFVAERLASLLLECEPLDLRDPETALRYAEVAAREDGDNPFYLETLAVAQYQTGDFRHAVETLRRALEIAGPDLAPLRQRMTARLTRYETELRE